MANVNIEIPPDNTKKQAQNSRKDRPKPAKITQGKEKKKTISQTFKETFIAEDFKTVGNWLLEDKIKPGIRQWTFNIFDDMLDWVRSSASMAIFGQDHRRRGQNYRNGYRDDRNYVQYNDYSSYYNSGERKDKVRVSQNSFRKGQLMDYYFETKESAQDVLDMLVERIYEYGDVAVADYYVSIGQSVNSTDYNYGWKDLSMAKVSRVDSDSWAIDFPKIIPLT